MPAYRVSAVHLAPGGYSNQHIESVRVSWPGGTKVYPVSEVIRRIRAGDVYIVDAAPYPEVEGSPSRTTGPHIRSVLDENKKDNLLNLPRF